MSWLIGQMTEVERDRSKGERSTIWFEVGDFLQYFDYAGRGTGIQRVQMEVFARAAVQNRSYGRIRFCRFLSESESFEAVDFATLTKVFDRGSARLKRYSTWPPPLPEGRPWLAKLLLERAKFYHTRQRFYQRIGRGLARLQM